MCGTGYALNKAIPLPGGTDPSMRLATLFSYTNGGKGCAISCKGYNGGGIDGAFSSTVANSLTELMTDMGVAGVFEAGSLSPKVFKGLLTMDAYIVTGNGGADIHPAIGG
ncbi:hypothetical protein AB0D24_38045 [Streptomyces javensis]|uniref:hypothetical protein n=1 Tax=Streptomyces javensis TaxID=114698 RepID=UPI0033C0E788